MQTLKKVEAETQKQINMEKRQERPRRSDWLKEIEERTYPIRKNERIQSELKET